eukprot:13430973-Alexandrium_andersonii.AAC.1
MEGVREVPCPRPCARRPTVFRREPSRPSPRLSLADTARRPCGAVSLGVVSKGNSPSKSSNRATTGATYLLGGDFYLRSARARAWASRADDPSRDAAVRPPRAPRPLWSQLL